MFISIRFLYENNCYFLLPHQSLRVSPCTHMKTFGNKKSKMQESVTVRLAAKEVRRRDTEARARRLVAS